MEKEIGYRRLPPLFIDVVLRTLFDFLDDEDLKQVKDVCKVWKEFGQEELERRGTITVDSDEEVLSIVESLKNPKKKTTNFAVEKCNLDNENFQNLLKTLLPTLSYLSLRGCSVKSVESYYSFMRKVQPEIKELDLAAIYFDIAGRPGYIKYIKYFPIPDAGCGKSHIIYENLRSLQLVSILGEEDGATPLSNVCKTFPNLKKLHLFNILNENPEKLKKIKMPFLKCLTIKIDPLKKLPTNQIDPSLCPCLDCASGSSSHCSQSDSGLTDIHLKMQLNLNLKLEELHLTNIGRRTDPDLFKAFLQSQSGTLKELTLEQFDRHHRKCIVTAPSPFPMTLPKLEKLKVDRVYVKNLNHVFNSCENLRKVDLDFYTGSDWRPILTPKIPPRPTLRSLSIGDTQPDVLKKLKPLWENLTALHLMNCLDELLPIIFEGAKKLQSLTVLEANNDSFLAATFTGILEEDIKTLVEREKAGVAILQSDAEALRGERKFIGTLKDLRYLTFGVFGTRRLKHIVKFAFKFCKELKLITVFDMNDETKVDSNSKFVVPDLKLFMEEEADYIPIPIRAKGFYEFMREDFYFSYEGGDEGTDQILRVLNLSGVGDELLSKSLGNE